MVKKLCRDFACSKSSKRRLREIAAPDLRAALAVRHLSGCERPCFVPRKVRDRHTKRHVSQGKMQNVEGGMWSSEHNLLNINRLDEIAENGVFRPNSSVVEKKCVD